MYWTGSSTQMKRFEQSGQRMAFCNSA